MFSLPPAKVGLAFRRRGCSPWIFRCNHSGLDPLNDDGHHEAPSDKCWLRNDSSDVRMPRFPGNRNVLLCLAKGMYANKAKLLGNVEFKMQWAYIMMSNHWTRLNPSSCSVWFWKHTVVVLLSVLYFTFGRLTLWSEQPLSFRNLSLSACHYPTCLCLRNHILYMIGIETHRFPRHKLPVGGINEFRKPKAEANCLRGDCASEGLRQLDFSNPGRDVFLSTTCLTYLWSHKYFEYSCWGLWGL